MNRLPSNAWSFHAPLTSPQRERGAIEVDPRQTPRHSGDDHSPRLRCGLVCRPRTRREFASGRRRGVLLLVVLSMLALFALIGVAFIIVGTNARLAAKGDFKAEQYGDDPGKQIDDAFAILIRGPSEPLPGKTSPSVLWHQSLLEDLYGLDGVKFSFTDTNPTTPPLTFPPPILFAGGQFVDLEFDTSRVSGSQQANQLSTTGVALNASQLAQIQRPAYYNGCVLTMLDGSHKNVSARIVGWGFASNKFTIRIMVPDGVSSAITGLTAVLINGRPFNGTGLGFDSSAAANAPTLLSLKDGTFFMAHLPNLKFALASGAPDSTTGGMDEGYDAADSQNMFLAYMPLNPQTPQDIIPSFHRPDLAAFMQTNAAAWTDTGPNGIQRKVLMRPNALDDPRPFTGSNPGFNITGPWDVDNDRDGVVDSVWIDIGLPVQTARDGRKFKPLVAVLIVDLDGRLNVNAHGSVAQVDANYTQTTVGTQIVKDPSPPTNLTLADLLYSNTGASISTGTVALPRGSGYGPAEVNLSLLFPDIARYQQFFVGTSGNFEGRYGEFGVAAPAAPFPAFPSPLPGITSGTRGSDDVLTAIKRFEFPFGYYSDTKPSSYGTPSDLWGRAVLGIDYNGQPQYSFLQNPNPGPAPPVGVVGKADPELPHDPYALNLSQNRVRASLGKGRTTTLGDNAFAPTELEKVLRKFDVDAASLPGRLKEFVDTPSSPPTTDPQHLVTTDSFSLPVTTPITTRDLIGLVKGQGVNPASLNIVDLLAARLAAGGTPPAQIQTRIPQLLSPEVLAGLRFDVNRPFGNGFDDDNNGVVDEPQEFSTTNEAAWTAELGTGVTFDLNNDGQVLFDPTNKNSDGFARQRFAKDLYILAMLLVDQNNTFQWAIDNGTFANAAAQKELLARKIAQWAINVVDFRDFDSIMTPFEYDVDPFNSDGWSVDGILTAADPDATKPDRRVVWGVEYPDLLLTEAMATHDRRVQDLGDDSNANPNNRAGDAHTGNPKDPDYDQVRVPEGSLFLELFCARNGNLSQNVNFLPGDLYDTTSHKLDLGKLAPATSGGLKFPVWRVAITASRAGDNPANPKSDVLARVTTHPDVVNFDPITPPTGPARNSLFGGASAVRVERIVWFASQNPSGFPDENVTYFNRLATPVALTPGKYALAGPRALTTMGKNVVGGTPANQRIDLSGGTAKVYDTADNEIYSSKGVAAPLPIICSSSLQPSGWNATIAPNFIGMSVSEPLFSSANYYPVPDDAANATYPNLKYMTAKDKPLDSQVGHPLADDKLAGLSTILNTGTTPNYKTALLQRLADPLSPFDAELNPYITVDWQPIDLTVFNGEARQTSGAATVDPDDPGFNTPPATLKIGSRERGKTVAGDNDLFNLLKQSPAVGGTVDSALGATAVFDYNLTHTLGFLNASFGTPWAPGAMTAQGTLFNGVPNPTTSKPFTWLTWNNRPYTSGFELTLVPATSAEELLRKFGSQVSATNDPYDPSVGNTGMAGAFPHLLNFWLAGRGDTGTAPYFGRLLDYVHVPSRFVGTETMLNPTSFRNALTNEDTMVSRFHPPFNKVSNYRDPGRININTIPWDKANPSTSFVWTALMNGSLIGGVAGPPTWQQIIDSRRGYGTPNSLPLLPDNTQPSFFANPFRSSGGSAFTLPGTDTPTRETDVTFLRPDPNDATKTKPLFDVPGSFTPPDFADSSRHAYFRHQPALHLNNMLTTHSNVYAIWITIGNFEVKPVPVSVAHPDGFRLGAEVGADTGDVKRHRSFYIYDRSIPVGFEPGRNHNIDKGILVRRFIE